LFPEMSMVIYSGIEFPVVPGTYQLPFQNGVLKVYGQDVMMRTAGQSEAYSHPNLSIKTGF